MATCRKCGRRDRLTLEQTGQYVFAAERAPTRLQANAAAMPEYRLCCEACAWSTVGYLDGRHLVEIHPSE